MSLSPCKKCGRMPEVKSCTEKNGQMEITLSICKCSCGQKVAAEGDTEKVGRFWNVCQAIG
jgi:hypothetical protein